MRQPFLVIWVSAKTQLFSQGVLHAWQLPPQALQFPPQEDFPAFLSLRSFTMIAITIAASTTHTRIVPQFKASHENMFTSSFLVYYMTISR